MLQFVKKKEFAIYISELQRGEYKKIWLINILLLIDSPVIVMIYMYTCAVVITVA